MICALSPASDNYEETLSTLRYADQAKKIKNCAVVNESATDKIIRELGEQNARMIEILKYMRQHGGFPPDLSTEEMRSVFGGEFEGSTTVGTSNTLGVTMMGDGVSHNSSKRGDQEEFDPKIKEELEQKELDLKRERERASKFDLDRAEMERKIKMLEEEAKAHELFMNDYGDTWENKLAKND
jgi:vacuolar-type H+-ATPase subunit I/STV1